MPDHEMPTFGKVEAAAAGVLGVITAVEVVNEAMPLFEAIDKAPINEVVTVVGTYLSGLSSPEQWGLVVAGMGAVTLGAWGAKKLFDSPFFPKGFREEIYVRLPILGMSPDQRRAASEGAAMVKGYAQRRVKSRLNDYAGRE